MKRTQYKFSSGNTTCYFDADINDIAAICDDESVIYITDENVFAALPKKFRHKKTIVLKAGEQFKTQATVDHLIGELIRFEADRNTWLVGVGGGVITDLVGYAGAIYMRGLRTGFVPTSVLAMVDASIGGKNGVDVGVYKNIAGTIRQPTFLLYDYSFLKTLPEAEWINGFAEIIKHAAIKDAAMFSLLESKSLVFFRRDRKAMASLIERNAKIKSQVVQGDEFEKGDRKLLNFGHTLGHAIENMYQLPHGHAVAIGMVAAGKLSAALEKFKEGNRIAAVLERYGLPAVLDFDQDKAFEILRMDKKRANDAMNYILLKRIGKALVRKIPLTDLKILFSKQLPL